MKKIRKKIQKDKGLFLSCKRQRGCGGGSAVMSDNVTSQKSGGRPRAESCSAGGLSKELFGLRSWRRNSQSRVHLSWVCSAEQIKLQSLTRPPTVPAKKNPPARPWIVLTSHRDFKNQLFFKILAQIP